MQTDQFLSQLIQLSQLRLKHEQPRQAPAKKTGMAATATGTATNCSAAIVAEIGGRGAGE